MLEEIIVAQKEENVFRRWFEDDFFELILWYNLENYSVRGFQLCYDIRRDEHSFTWNDGAGFAHNRVDDGTRPLRHPSSPTLVEDGLFPARLILDRFIDSSAGIDRAIARLVLTKLNEYGKVDANLEEIFQELDKARIAPVTAGAEAPGAAPETAHEPPVSGELKPEPDPAAPGWRKPRALPGFVATCIRVLKERFASRAPFMESAGAGRERYNADELMKQSRVLAKKLSKKR
jgi:hypothetical protein